jgi:hypothetical protein
MTMQDTESSFREAAAALTPRAVSEFLRACESWKLEDRIDHVKEIWTRPASDVGPSARVMLPLATDYADYAQRFADALHAIAIVSNWDADEVLRRVISTNADLFFVRLDQVQADGTIPLRQAEAAVDAIFEMVKAAAITVATPNRNQRGGRLPGIVSTFLEEDVRLGHTKPGSFVFTVVTRLDRPAMPTSASGSDVVSAFPRKVMETLARGLEITRDLAQGKTAVSMEDPAQSGLSAALVESLEGLVGAEDLRSLELSFQWATTRTRPTAGAVPVHLEHSEVRELRRVRELLLRHEEPPHRETLFGMVRELARGGDDSESEDAGSVVISAEVNGRRRNVRMILSGEDHRRAIESYRYKLPLIVTGDLVFEHQAWRLVGDIEVDARLIDRVPLRGAAEDPEPTA